MACSAAELECTFGMRDPLVPGTKNSAAAAPEVLDGEDVNVANY